MSKIFSTGPVENAAGNSAISVLVKILNNHTGNSLSVKIFLYDLKGLKEKVASANLTISPLSSDFTSFNVESINEYEVQIEVSFAESVLVSVWGLDADANLIAAQRFVQNELNEVTIMQMPKDKRHIKPAVRRGWKKGRL